MSPSRSSLGLAVLATAVSSRGVAASGTGAAVEDVPCLCVFDIDRTLTGKQGDIEHCPNNTVLDLFDEGYGGGNATLSDLSTTGIRSTFCNGCHLGICSAGEGSGVGSEWNNYLLSDVMRSEVHDAFINRNPEEFQVYSHGIHVHSPYVLGQGNRLKQHSVELIRQWYGSNGVNIDATEVYFFGDRTENMQPFEDKGMNSREISCGSRDPWLHHGTGMVGYCGARPDEIVREKGNANCPATVQPACLCVFDIDRTLTGKQGDTAQCPNNVVTDMHDEGYGGGQATLSALAVAGIKSTFCNGCHLGICSAGEGSGVGSEWNNYLLSDVMRSEVHDAFINRNPEEFQVYSHGIHVHSPYVLGQGNRLKQHSVELIRQWYGSNGVNIDATEVYFFGDRTENMQPFEDKGMNSREISCGSRDPWLHDGDGMVGYCGAKPDEVVRTKGNANCGNGAAPDARNAHFLQDVILP